MLDSNTNHCYKLLHAKFTHTHTHTHVYKCMYSCPLYIMIFNLHGSTYIWILCVCVFLLFLGPLPMAYGGFQAGGLVRAAAAGPRHSHSNAGSEQSLQPTPQLTTTPDP